MGERYIPLCQASSRGPGGSGFALSSLGSEVVAVPEAPATLLAWLGREDADGNRYVVDYAGYPGASESIAWLEERGLVLGEKAYLELFLSPARSGATAGRKRIGAIAVITKDRPRSLARCVDSYLGLLESRARSGKGEKPCPIVACDSGEGGEETLAPFARRASALGAGAGIRYLGLREKAAFAELLRASSELRGLEPETLEFGLFGDRRWDYKGGANRNWAILDSAGERLLLSDDDKTARWAPHPERLPGLALSSAPVPSEPFFGQGWVEAAGEPGYGEVDLLALHESLLARLPAEAALEWGGSVEIGEASPRLLQRLVKAQAPVLATVAGALGDSGLGSPRALLSLEGPPRERLLSSRRGYEEAIVSRRVLWAVPRATVSDSPYIRADTLGLDLARLAPPFLPCGKNDECLPGILVSRCYGGGAIAHVPAAVEHEPEQPRRFARESIRAFEVRLSDLVSWAVLDAAIPRFPCDAEETLCDIGCHLESVGLLPRDSFEEYMGRLWLRQAGAGAERLEALLERYGGSPRFWAEDVEASLEGLVEKVGRGRSWLPSDIRAGEGGPGAEEDAIAACQEVMIALGGFLAAWPAMLSAARRLAAEGRRPSRAL